MKSIKSQNMSGRERRHRRIRAKVSGTKERPRLSIFRSNKHIYAQIIDDSLGKTLVSASDEEMKSVKGKGKLEISKVVGEEVARRALEKKVLRVVFDRSGYLYAGRVKQIAEGARAGGLDF